jgi:plastocyanin
LVAVAMPAGRPERSPFWTLAGVAAAAALGASAATALALSETPRGRAEPASTGGTLRAQTVAPVAVKIVEPPLQPPPTWTYEPKIVTVKPGTKVTWINTGAVVHTVTADDAKTFDSGNMPSNASFSFTPTTPGTFSYHCKQHPWMKAALVVAP